MRTLRLLPLFSLVLVSLLASPARAQKLDSKYRPFSAHGFEFKPLKDMSDVPANERLASRGIVAQFEIELGKTTKTVDGDVISYAPQLFVFRVDPPAAMTGESIDPAERARLEALPKTPADFIEAAYPAGKLTAEETRWKGPRKIDSSRDAFTSIMQTTGGRVEIVYDVYSFTLDRGKAVFVWDYPADKKSRKKWETVVVKSMKSFRMMRKGASDSDVGAVNSESSYEDLLAYHQHEVAQTPGWRLVEVPSKNYLIKTNSDDKDDVKEVIVRLEASRELYEEDFPPFKPITSVSVVRICATREEFNTYGQTGGGVAGYFNPRSEELVLFFGQGSKQETLAVMTHEGFHQYCHFLFDRSEAHRWFDEGHGDYYGAWELRGKKLKPAPDMRGGLARVPEIKEMLRNGAIKPLSEHIRYDHGSWQGQGPSNVSCYAQSFALIYFLREGARKKVKSRYWEPEYAEIIPNYMDALYEGYRAAYDEIVEDAKILLAILEGDQEAELPEIFEDLDLSDMDQATRNRMLELANERIARPWDFFRFGKDEIWEAAMDASWGQIDEAEFEEKWLEYVEKEM